VNFCKNFCVYLGIGERSPGSLSGDRLRSGSLIPGIAIWDRLRSGSLIPGIAIWDRLRSGSLIPGIAVWDRLRSGSPIPKLAIPGIHRRRPGILYVEVTEPTALCPSDACGTTQPREGTTLRSAAK